MRLKKIWVDGVSRIVPLTEEDKAHADIVVVPSQVTKLQLVRALRAAGHWGGVKSAIAQSDTVTKEDWDYAYAINRDDPLMQAFAGALGLTPADMDALFVNGATL